MSAWAIELAAHARGLLRDYNPSRGDLFLLSTKLFQESPLAVVGIPLRRS